MKKKNDTDIWFYVVVGAVLILVVVATIYRTINESCEYERGYLDGFRNGMVMHDTDYGTIKLERKGGEE